LVIIAGIFVATAIKNGGSVSAGDLVISKSEVTEKAKFYPYNADGTRMEILAVRAGDGSIRTAFNTCQVCNGSSSRENFWFARTAETASVWIWLSRKGAAATRCRLQRMKKRTMAQTSLFREIFYCRDNKNNFTANKLYVQGMTCTGCETRIENVLRKLDGVTDVKASYTSSTVYVADRGKA